MNIIWSPLALERISDIARYISQDSTNHAEKWVHEIFRSVEKLADFPSSGRIVPEINRPEIREVIYGNYRIVYRSDCDVINILTIRHGKQILPIDEIIPT